MIPGEIFGRPATSRSTRGADVEIDVENTGDRPIQVGSHYHFYETNPSLRFDREPTRGYRLDIAAGTAVRFEPGQSRTVRWSHTAGSARIRFSGQNHGRSVNGVEDLAPGVRGDVRPHGGRSGASRRHRACHRSGEGLHGLRRGGEIRRRQGDPRRHGPGAGRRAPGWPTPSSPTR